MKDLDFDELDRAVNSLMEKAPTEEAEKSDTSPAASSPQPTPLAQPVAPVVATPSPVSSSPSVSRPSVPAARRGGKFMDMMHPAAVKKETPAQASRQGITVQPTNSSMMARPQKPEMERSSMAQPEPTPLVATPTPISQDVTPSHATPATSTDWPDPLDVASGVKTSVEPGESEAPLQPTEAARPIDDTPLSSPFLPDAKVEKRPLGGNSSPEVVSTPVDEDENAQLPALPKDVEPALPEELHGDVVSIEADNSTTNPHHTEPTLSAPPEAAPKKESPEPVKKPEITVTEAAPVGPTSISQQYREEPSTSDQKSGAIYDTKDYHQPLAHPAKKKSGWMWVIWIVIILMLGAGGGAALYFLGIV